MKLIRNSESLTDITNQMSWTALISILILKYLKKIGKHDWSMSNLIAFLRMNLFVKIDLTAWLNHPFEESSRAEDPGQEVFLWGK